MHAPIWCLHWAAHGHACTPAYMHSQPGIMSYDTLMRCVHCLLCGVPRRRSLAVHTLTQRSVTHSNASQTYRDATTERPGPCRQTRAHRSLTITHIHTHTHPYTHTHARTHTHTHCCRAVTLARGCTRAHTWAINVACLRAPSPHWHTHADRHMRAQATQARVPARRRQCRPARPSIIIHAMYSAPSP